MDDHEKRVVDEAMDCYRRIDAEPDETIDLRPLFRICRELDAARKIVPPGVWQIRESPDSPLYPEPRLVTR